MADIEKIILTDIELEVLKRTADGTYNPMTATPAEQDAEIRLIDKAGEFERKYDLVDERIDFSEDCSLLKWFYHKYQTQE